VVFRLNYEYTSETALMIHSVYNVYLCKYVRTRIVLFFKLPIYANEKRVYFSRVRKYIIKYIVWLRFQWNYILLSRAKFKNISKKKIYFGFFVMFLRQQFYCYNNFVKKKRKEKSCKNKKKKNAKDAMQHILPYLVPYILHIILNCGMKTKYFL